MLREIHEHFIAMAFEAAGQVEKDLAEDLRRAGYTVMGGHQPGASKELHDDIRGARSNARYRNEKPKRIGKIK